MVWRVGARVHAFVHGLFKPGEAELVRQAQEELASLFRQVGVADAHRRAHLIAVIAEDVWQRLGVRSDHEQAEVIHAFIEQLFDHEGLFVLPDVDWGQKRTIAELWDIRDCQDFRVWAGIMGKKESHYVPTQRTCDTE